MSDAWRKLAKCRGVDSNVFFPHRGEPTEEARELCAGCPVHEQCAEDAIQDETRLGFAGRLSESERRAIRRQRRIQARDTGMSL